MNITRHTGTRTTSPNYTNGIRRVVGVYGPVDSHRENRRRRDPIA